MFWTVFYISLLCMFLYALVKSSDYLILYATIIARRLHISQFILGVTIVAIGTSLPELVSVVYGLLTSAQGGDFVSGTIIGSNIANSLLVFGVLLFFISKPLQKLSKIDTLFLVLSTLFISAYVYFSLSLLFLSIGAIIVFIFYILLMIFKPKFSKDDDSNIKELADLEELNEEEEKYKTTSSFIIILFFIISVLFLNLSARGIVFGIDNIAQLFNIPQFLLTFTTIALATSLPELIVTIQAARKNDSKLALGNIIGSNVSNILLIGGVGLTMSVFLNILISVTLMTLIFLLFSLIVLIITIIIFSKTIKYSTLIGALCVGSYILIILYNVILAI